MRGAVPNFEVWISYSSHFGVFDQIQGFSIFVVFLRVFDRVGGAQERSKHRWQSGKQGEEHLVN